MSVKEEGTQELKLEIQSTKVSEIGDADVEWSGEDVVVLEDDEVAEITKGDDKPFFVKFVALYSGMSTNKCNYTDAAVTSCVDAMVGVNMYKGHVEPGSQSWKYREPAGRVVAAKLGRIDIPGKKGVLCAMGKAYITEADPKLRSDIRKGMAGNVSILGNARSVRKLGDTKRDVVLLHKPLDSVDFCNPGTGGLKHAGVTAVVAEMSSQVIDGDETVSETKKEETTQMAKLTKEELLAEYAPEITALVGEQIDHQVSEINANRREIAQQKEDFKDEKATLEGKVQEMTDEVATLKSQNDELQKQLNDERDARIGAELKVYADEQVAEMKKLDGANETLIDMAVGKTAVDVVDGDLNKSKLAFTAALKDSLDEVVKLAEMFGGGGGGGGGEPNPVIRSHANNPNPAKKKGSGLEKLMNPELAAARKKRVGATA